MTRSGNTWSLRNAQGPTVATIVVGHWTGDVNRAQLKLALDQRTSPDSPSAAPLQHESH